ncbi:AbrB family transcriptional regulator [Rhodobacteraceae bacterium F11138]|nr:AbrB family transcriptional regulator [Rhodobacteraceae bacterium F11138]
MTYPRTKALQLILILGGALMGALAARALGLPLPFLLGSLIVTASLSLTYYARTGQRLWFPISLRQVFIGVIGVMIGSTFSPEALSMAGDLVITLSAMVVFVAVAQAVNYLIFRKVGRYDRMTATYSAMPGGLIEAVTLGEQAGADTEVLSVQHFVRVILVIAMVPMLFLVFTGHTVGSAAGQAIGDGAWDWTDWALIAVLAAGGIILGLRIRIPARHLIGPMVLTAVLQSLGVVELHGPQPLLNLAQLVVGAGLGTMFARSTPRRLLMAFALGVLSVAVTLAIASGFALALAHWVPMSFQSLLVSFAPGGVTEMSLIALSLGVSPVLVTTHHLFRIVFTVTVAGILTARALRPGTDP